MIMSDGISLIICWREWFWVEMKKLEEGVCFSRVSFLILVNESSEGYFVSMRGLRQWDALFPYLFLVVMEALED